MGAHMRHQLLLPPPQTRLLGTARYKPNLFLLVCSGASLVRDASKTAPNPGCSCSYSSWLRSPNAGMQFARRDVLIWQSIESIQDGETRLLRTCTEPSFLDESGVVHALLLPVMSDIRPADRLSWKQACVVLAMLHFASFWRRLIVEMSLH
jgi:hypothetical protein